MVNQTKIQVGKPYWITWKDPNYPCDCECHANNVGKIIMHCFPCCIDISYEGWGICIENKGMGYFLFSTTKYREALYHQDSIINEAHINMSEFSNQEVKEEFLKRGLHEYY